MNNFCIQLITFISMVIVGMLFNPMNVLAYRVDDLYLSTTLFYSGLLMASNMIWSHQIIHYLTIHHINFNVFVFGLLLSILVVILLRKQLLVNDKQWLRRMISHHSTALTTSHNIYNKTTDPKVKQLAKNIINTQEQEIQIMKDIISY